MAEKRRSYSWAVDMEYPMEMQKLSRMSYFGTGIGKGLQIPEWDYKSVGDHTTPARLFLKKRPRDMFSVDLKREMVENDKRLKTSMVTHRNAMTKEKKLLEQNMRKNTKPFVCYRGNILSRYGEVFNDLPSSLVKKNVEQSTNTETSDQVDAPMTIVDAETVVSEQYVTCDRCRKSYKESRNVADACRFHMGPIIGVFGGMCQHCGQLDFNKGCMTGYHTRKQKHQSNTYDNSKPKQ